MIVIVVIENSKLHTRSELTLIQSPIFRQNVSYQELYPHTFFVASSSFICHRAFSPRQISMYFCQQISLCVWSRERLPVSMWIWSDIHVLLVSHTIHIYFIQLIVTRVRLYTCKYFSNSALQQHFHNPIFHWNFQKYSVFKIVYDIMCVWEFQTMHCGILINIAYSSTSVV